MNQEDVNKMRDRAMVAMAVPSSSRISVEVANYVIDLIRELEKVSKTVNADWQSEANRLFAVVEEERGKLKRAQELLASARETAERHIAESNRLRDENDALRKDLKRLISAVNPCPSCESFACIVATELTKLRGLADEDET